MAILLAGLKPVSSVRPALLADLPRPQEPAECGYDDLVIFGLWQAGDRDRADDAHATCNQGERAAMRGILL